MRRMQSWTAYTGVANQVEPQLGIAWLHIFCPELKSQTGAIALKARCNLIVNHYGAAISFSHLSLMVTAAMYPAIAGTPANYYSYSCNAQQKAITPHCLLHIPTMPMQL